MRKQMAACAATLSFIAMIATPAGARSAVQPIPPYITIGAVTANGSGCPWGTVAVNWSLDRTAFTVTYSDFLAQAGPGVSVLENRRNCQVNFQVNIPQGFTYAIAKTDYRGFAHLAGGVTAIEGANYYFGGQTPSVYKQHYISGPYDNNWAFTDQNSVTALVFHPCGIRPIFNINQSLRVTSSPSKVSYVTMDSTDASFSTVYHVSWKTCPI